MPTGRSLESRSILTKTAVSSADISVIATDGTTQLGVLTITEAWVALKEIELEMAENEIDSPEEEEQQNEIEYEGPFLVNLLTDEISPEPELIDILPGLYEEIELKIDKIEDDETDDDSTPLVTADDPIYGYSIYIEGTYTGTIDGTQYNNLLFVLAYEFDEEVTFSGSDESLGFTIEDAAFNSLIIAFRLNKWFNFSDTETNSDEVDFNDLTVTTGASGNEVRLDENVEASLSQKVREVIKENIKHSADYGKDEDENGELESNEDDDPDTEDDDD